MHHAAVWCQLVLWYHGADGPLAFAQPRMISSPTPTVVPGPHNLQLGHATSVMFLVMLIQSGEVAELGKALSQVPGLEGLDARVVSKDTLVVQLAAGKSATEVCLACMIIIGHVHDVRCSLMHARGEREGRSSACRSIADSAWPTQEAGLR
jgi:hypothetical protein